MRPDEKGDASVDSSGELFLDGPPCIVESIDMSPTSLSIRFPIPVAVSSREAGRGVPSIDDVSYCVLALLDVEGTCR